MFLHIQSFYVKEIFTGINIDEDTKRYYPYNNLASHFIGFCGSDNQGLDGIEAKYFKNTENDTKYFIDIANKRKMIYTAGSDFHNYIESYRLHGMIGDVYLNNEEIEKFLKVLN